MAAPSYTYTLTNGTTADASQVMQNFNDLLNGITDGSKDLTINALTLGGSLTANGDVALGNATTDTLTVNALLGSDIVPSANATYNIGSALKGMAGVYLGNSTFTTKLATAASASYTLTLPATGGTARQRVVTDGSGGLSFYDSRGSASFSNLGLTATVAANALTIALKGADGNDPSATNVVEASFRSATAATGTPLNRTATAATSLVISSGSTLGHASGVASYIYVYLIDNAGTIELAASSSLFDEGSRQSTTTEGGGGAADSGTIMYSTTARTNVGVRLIGRMSSTQATAGTWATAISEISLVPFEKTRLPTQRVYLDTGNGHGAVNTKIRRFSNSSTSGVAITYADSANNGMSLTINESGIYAINYTDHSSGVQSFGLSLNSTHLTTNVESTSLTPNTERLNCTNNPSAASGCLSWVGPLAIGDVVRCHGDGSALFDSNSQVQLQIFKIA